jgi:hypothetical protein
MRAEIQLALIIALGLLSRAVPTGWMLLDKYAGDALYAAMVYTLLTLLTRLPAARMAWIALAMMTALELFQLTMIPAQLIKRQNLALRITARLLGTEFSFLDLLAYAVGISGSFLHERRTTRQIP